MRSEPESGDVLINAEIFLLSPGGFGSVGLVFQCQRTLLNMDTFSEACLIHIDPAENTCICCVLDAGQHY